MRLYHALLVTAVALLASNASAGRADCDMIPGDVIESSSGSVEQGSTANSAVDASQASQASQGSAQDTPEQQYSQTASASGSAPKDSFDGYDASNDSPIQQGSAVDASQASQGSAPSDETPVQQYSTTNSGASQPASASGSAPKDSFDGYDASNDSPIQQGSAVDASQASQGSAPSDETPVQQFSTTNSQGSAPSDASFTSSYPGPTPDFPEYSQGSAPADFPEYGQGSAPTDSPAQQFSTANSDVGSSQVNQGSAPTDASFTSSYVGPTPDFPEYGQGSAPTDSPAQQFSTANSDVGSSQVNQGSAPTDASFTSSYVGPTPEFPEYGQGSAPTESPVQQFSTANSDVGASQVNQGSAPSDETPVQQFSTANSDVGASQVNQGSAPSDETPVQQFSTANSDVGASQVNQGSAPSDETPVQQFSTANSDVGASQVNQGSAPSDETPVQQFSTANSDVGASQVNQGSAPSDETPVQQFSTANSDVGASQVNQGSAPSDETPVQQFSTANSDVGASQVNQGSAPSDETPVQQFSTANSDVGASQVNQGSAPSDETPVQQFSTANSDVGASQVNQGSAPSDETPVQQFSTANSDVGASQVNQGSAPSDETPVQQFTTTNSASQASGSDDVQQGVVVPGGDVEDASQKTDVAGESDINFKTTLAPTATTAAPEVAASSSGSSASNSTVTTSSTGFCAKPRVRITEVDVGAAIENNEEEAALKVIAIAALPSGGSRIAFQSGDNVIVRELDANDKLVASSPAVKVPMNDFADIYADKNGFVILGTRDAEGGGTLNCGNPSNLCGGGPSPASPCYDMYMARYDGTSEKWATKLTSSSASLPPYSTGKTGPDVYMIWWYAHHGRIAYDGTNWAAYFGAAISTSEGGCINIHQGDRMKVVSPSGAITDSEDSFDWGCSHSGYERITYDERSKSFASICKTDSNNRLMPPNNWDATIYPVNLAASDLGDIVPDSVASSNKYWSAVSNGDGDNAKVHLIHYDLKSQASEDIVLGGTDANERAPHLAAMGKDGMLAMWEGSSAGGDLQEGSDRTIYAQVLNRATGKALSEKITVDKSVVGNRYQALKSYPDGSVAYLSKGKTGTSVQVVRFFGC